MKLLLALFVSASIISGGNQNSYKIVDKDNQFITVEMNGQLERWFVDEENKSIQIGDNVFITNDMRLIKTNNK